MFYSLFFSLFHSFPFKDSWSMYHQLPIRNKRWQLTGHQFPGWIWPFSLLTVDNMNGRMWKKKEIIEYSLFLNIYSYLKLLITIIYQLQQITFIHIYIICLLFLYKNDGLHLSNLMVDLVKERFLWISPSQVCRQDIKTCGWRLGTWVWDWESGSGCVDVQPLDRAHSQLYRG